MASTPSDVCDPELVTALAYAPFSSLTRQTIADARAVVAKSGTLGLILSAFPSITHDERRIPGPRGEIVLSVLRPAAGHTGGTYPAIYYMHGGGMILGTRFTTASIPAEWVAKLNIVCILVEYRLAPEHPGQAPVEDCYAGLKWVSENAVLLDIDPQRLIVGGQSAGGGLAAGTVLLARDRGGPEIKAQILISPMLDDRNETPSSKQFTDLGPWTRANNLLAWDCLLGKHDGNVSIYASPARATDLSNLPPAFIDVGSAELFRDEDVSYASQLSASGVMAELHVWPGAFHGSDLMVPSASISQSSRRMRTDWVSRVLSL